MPPSAEGLFGFRIGARSQHVGVFAKVRPGFICYESAQPIRELRARPTSRTLPPTPGESSNTTQTTAPPRASTLALRLSVTLQATLIRVSIRLAAYFRRSTSLRKKTFRCQPAINDASDRQFSQPIT